MASTGGSPSAGLLGQIKVKAYSKDPTSPLASGLPHHRHVCKPECDVDFGSLKQHCGRPGAWQKKEELHSPGIEPGSGPWQGPILPLDQECSNVRCQHRNFQH